MLLQNLTIILLTIIEFVNSTLISFLSNYIFEGFIIAISIISLASGSRATKVLDVGAKLIGSAAGSTFLYNYWIKGSNSLPSNDDKDKNKDNKKENKETINNQGTNGK